MIPLSSSPVNPPTIEQGVESLVSDAKHKVSQTYEDCAQCVRESPAKAVLLAVAVGYCLHRLPVRALLVAKVRLIVALAPPALLAFGAAKLCEFLQTQARKENRIKPRSQSSGTLRSFD